jgi:hypothetical protein
MLEADYDEIDALRGMVINEFHKSARQGKWCMEHKQNRSDSAEMSLYRGIAIHARLLEPERFRAHAVEPGKIGPTAIVTYRKAQADLGPDAIVLADGWGVLCEDLARLVLEEHPASREVFAVPGHNELAAVWDDPDLGVAGKVRLDRIREDGVILDLKTTAATTLVDFQRIAARLGYHRKFAWQTRGSIMSGLSPVDAGIFSVMVMCDPPYDVVVLHDTAQTMAQGWAECVIAAGRYRRYRETGAAPGISDRILPSYLPRYLQDESMTTSIPIGGTK